MLFFFFFFLPPPSDRDTISANYFHACSFTELHASTTLAADSLVYSRNPPPLSRPSLHFLIPASCLSLSVLFLSPLASPAPSSNSPSLVVPPPPRPLRPALSLHIQRVLFLSFLSHCLFPFLSLLPLHSTFRPVSPYLLP